MNKKYLLSILGVVIFIILLWKYHIYENFLIIKEDIKITPIMLSTIIINLVIVLKAIRWKYLMSKIQQKAYSLKESFLVIGFGSFLATATPLRAGEVSKVILFQNRNEKKQVGMIIGIEYCSDVFAFLVYTSLLFLLYAYDIFPVFVLILIGILLLFIFLLRTKIQNFVLSIIMKKKIFSPEYMILLKSMITRETFFVSFFVGIMNLFIFGFVGYIIFLSLGIPLSFSATLMGLAFSQVIGVLSLIPFGLGTREVSALWFFSQYGLENSILPGLIILRLLTFFQIACLYGLYLITVSKST